MSIGFFICVLIIIAYAGMLALKEHRCGQELRRNKKRREEEQYNYWLHQIGLCETSYYFNPYGIRLLNDWLLLDKDIL